jgi:hypothetical protein
MGAAIIANATWVAVTQDFFANADTGRLVFFI